MIMPSGFLNYLDILKSKIGDAVTLIDETQVATPEVTGIHPVTGQQIAGVASAREISGTHYETSARIGLPSVSLRQLNDGADYTKSEYKKEVVPCFLANPRWGVDSAINTVDNSVPEVLATEAQGHLIAYLQLLGRMFFYGTNAALGGVVDGIKGLLQAVSAGMTVDAGGTTADGCSSAYAVSFGDDGVRWVSGLSGQHEITDPRMSTETGVNGKPYTAIVQEMFARPGLQIAAPQLRISRIKNLTAQAGKTLSGDMLAELKLKHKLSYKPQAIFTTERVIEQYRQSLQATTSSPNRIDTVYTFEGIPLVPTESLVDIEPVNLAE
jgi:hypothetical protein